MPFIHGGSGDTDSMKTSNFEKCVFLTFKRAHNWRNTPLFHISEQMVKEKREITVWSVKYLWRLVCAIYLIILKHCKFVFLQLATQDVNVPFIKSPVIHQKFSSGFILRLNCLPIISHRKWNLNCLTLKATKEALYFLCQLLPETAESFPFAHVCVNHSLPLSPTAPGIHHWPKWQIGRGTSRPGRVCYWPEWQPTDLQGAALLWGGSGGLPHRYSSLT